MSKFQFDFKETHLAHMLGNNQQYDRWYDALEVWLPKYEITTRLRVASFVAQTAHESQNYTRLEENLNYRWTTLREVFWKYFPTDELAKKYAHKKQAIANRVYGNRMGNGSEASGDGYKYRGRGLIQVTGKNNYTEFAEFADMSVEDTFDYLTTYEGAVHSACWYWHTRNLNRWADIADQVELTKRINGGDNGLKDRIYHFEKNMSILGASAAEILTTLRRGSQGPAVRDIQRALKIDVDGDYGPKTESAVRAFQKSNGLVVDGIAGPVTLSLLLG